MSKKKRLELAAVGAFALLGVAGCGDGPGPAALPVPAVASEAEERESRRQGFHCLDEGGTHSGMETLIRERLVIRERLDDPGFMVTHETRILPMDSAFIHHPLFVDFSVKAAAGGRVLYTATGGVNPDTCEATLIGIISE